MNPAVSLHQMLDINPLLPSGLYVLFQSRAHLLFFVMKYGKNDYHLFEEILTEMNEEKKTAIQHYLTLLQLDKVVEVNDGKFSSLSLSDGQRKRLALLVAFLDDADIYLFDEWAADQDPIYKKYFYHDILKELKEKIQAAVNLYNTRDFLKCQETTKKLMELNPNVVFLYNLLGLVMTAQKKNDEAVEI